MAVGHEEADEEALHPGRVSVAVLAIVAMPGVVMPVRVAVFLCVRVRVRVHAVVGVVRVVVGVVRVVLGVVRVGVCVWGGHLLLRL
ncbi:hypothetical protein GCM10009766_23650 [Microcella frigidaquae]